MSNKFNTVDDVIKALDNFDVGLKAAAKPYTDNIVTKQGELDSLVQILKDQREILKKIIRDAAIAGFMDNATIDNKISKKVGGILNDSVKIELAIKGKDEVGLRGEETVIEDVSKSDDKHEVSYVSKPVISHVTEEGVSEKNCVLPFSGDVEAYIGEYPPVISGYGRYTADNFCKEAIPSQVNRLIDRIVIAADLDGLGRAVKYCDKVTGDKLAEALNAYREAEDADKPSCRIALADAYNDAEISQKKFIDEKTFNGSSLGTLSSAAALALVEIEKQASKHVNLKSDSETIKKYQVKVNNLTGALKGLLTSPSTESLTKSLQAYEAAKHAFTEAVTELNKSSITSMLRLSKTSAKDNCQALAKEVESLIIKAAPTVDGLKELVKNKTALAFYTNDRSAEQIKVEQKSPTNINNKQNQNKL